jgi:hypothetical protein
MKSIGWIGIFVLISAGAMGQNVGIGTASPMSKLHVHDNAASTYIFTSNSTSSIGLGVENIGPGKAIGALSLGTGVPLNINQGGNPSLYINENSNVGLSTIPHPSAILDVSATNRGILLPRMTLNQRQSIANPASGLLIYRNEGNGSFDYFTGSSWTSLNSQLELIIQNNKAGWRLRGWTPTLYGSIGAGAVDLSQSDGSPSTTKGATGDNSFAAGISSTAEGFASFAFGLDSKALGANSVAIGTNSSAEGPGSVAIGVGPVALGGQTTALGWNTRAINQGATAFGFNTEAAGFFSTSFGSDTRAGASSATAFGLGTNANGTASTAFGDNTLASGRQSTALGWRTIAQAQNSFAIGSFNIAQGSTNSIVTSDVLFAAGNGTSDDSRSNALVLLKNGNLGIANANNPNIRFAITENGLGIHRPSTNVLALHTTGAERLRISPSGKVGIATNAPSTTANLTIRGGNWNLATSDGDLMIGEGDARLKISMSVDGGGVGIARINSSGGFANQSLRMGVNNQDLIILNNSGHLLPFNNGTQNLGSGTQRYNTVFATNGTINTSDARLKKNIRDIRYGLQEVMAMRAVEFTWKDDVGGKTKLGLLAQDLQKLIPQVVEGNEHETLGVYYADLIPVLIKALQEQQEQLNELKKQIAK